MTVRIGRSDDVGTMSEEAVPMLGSRFTLSICALLVGGMGIYTLMSLGEVNALPLRQMPVESLFLFGAAAIAPLLLWLGVFFRHRKILRRF